MDTARTPLSHTHTSNTRTPPTHAHLPRTHTRTLTYDPERSFTWCVEGPESLGVADVDVAVETDDPQRHDARWKTDVKMLRKLRRLQ